MALAGDDCDIQQPVLHEACRQRSEEVQCLPSQQRIRAKGIITKERPCHPLLRAGIHPRGTEPLRS
eukprot:scaffold290923_cov46-Prasinocladus_malaysianus.AAC.1